MENEKSIAQIKVKETDLCVKCEEELKTQKMSGGFDLFGSSSGSGAFYCNNNSCEFYGYLTLVRKVRSEKVVEMADNK